METASFNRPPELLTDLSAEDLRRFAVSAARRRHSAEFDLARILAHVQDAQRSGSLGHGTVFDFAAAELGLSKRKTYHLLRVEKLTRKLPATRTAWATGEISFAHVRAVVLVAEPHDEAAWLEKARNLRYSALVSLVKSEAHARAERGERPWPGTNLYGPMGKPEPRKQLERPYTPYLLALEAQVREKHARSVGAVTSWAEFYESVLVEFEQSLDQIEMGLAPYVRETLDRDGWRCRVSFCSALATLHVHHLVHRSQGGKDEVDGCLAICAAHHRLHHAGLLLIEGRPSTGLRFAHRASCDAEWIYWPGTSHGPEPWDANADSFDVDALADLEPPIPAPPGTEALRQSGKTRSSNPRPRPYAGAARPYWLLDEGRPAYGEAAPPPGVCENVFKVAAERPLAGQKLAVRSADSRPHSLPAGPPSSGHAGLKTFSNWQPTPGKITGATDHGMVGPEPGTSKARPRSLPDMSAQPSHRSPDEGRPACAGTGPRWAGCENVFKMAVERYSTRQGVAARSEAPGPRTLRSGPLSRGYAGLKTFSNPKPTSWTGGDNVFKMAVERSLPQIAAPAAEGSGSTDLVARLRACGRPPRRGAWCG